MQDIILQEQWGAQTKIIHDCGSHITTTIHVDAEKLKWFTDMCQEQRNSPDIKFNGEEMLTEAFRIPEELYYQWMFEATQKGCKPGKEVQNFIIDKLNSGDFDKLRVGKYKQVKK